MSFACIVLPIEKMFLHVHQQPGLNALSIYQSIILYPLAIASICQTNS